jgi:hypothetical protein
MFLKRSFSGQYCVLIVEGNNFECDGSAWELITI